MCQPAQQLRCEWWCESLSFSLISLAVPLFGGVRIASHAAMHTYSAHRERPPLLCSKVLGPNHGDVAQTVNNLAIVLTATKNEAEAEELYRRCVSTIKVGLPPCRA